MRRVRGDGERSTKKGAKIRATTIVDVGVALTVLVRKQETRKDNRAVAAAVAAVAAVAVTAVVPTHLFLHEVDQALERGARVAGVLRETAQARLNFL